MAPIPLNSRSILVRSPSGEATESRLPVWFWCLLAAVCAACLGFFIYKSVLFLRGQNADRDTDIASVEAGTSDVEELIPKPTRAHSRQS